MSEPSPAFSSGWFWLFPPVYLIHLVDERLWGIGTADFATQQLGIWFTNEAWLWVNVPSMFLLTLAAGLGARRRWPQWVAVSLAIHLALHGLGRVPTSLWSQMIAPGLVSGLLLCAPLAGVAGLRAWHALSPTELRTGVLVGIASFQPFWHFVLLPFLPAPPG